MLVEHVLFVLLLEHDLFVCLWQMTCLIFLWNMFCFSGKIISGSYLKVSIKYATVTLRLLLVH